MATKVSERTCVACRRVAAREELLRFVLGSEDGGRDILTFDATKRRPGRGVWTCSSADCFEKAVEKGQLVRGLRAFAGVQNDEVVADLRRGVALYLDTD